MINNPYFDHFITFVILCNTFMMALTYFDMGETHIYVSSILNYVFLFIFTMEAVIKIYGLRWSYFKDGWNFFDFIVVVFTIVVLIMSELQIVENITQLAMVLRMLRIGRMFRLVKRV